MGRHCNSPNAQVTRSVGASYQTPRLGACGSVLWLPVSARERPALSLFLISIRTGRGANVILVTVRLPQPSPSVGPVKAPLARGFGFLGHRRVSVEQQKGSSGCADSRRRTRQSKRCQCACPARFFVHPKDYKPGLRKVDQAWFRIPGKDKNRDIAWTALEDLMVVAASTSAEQNQPE